MVITPTAEQDISTRYIQITQQSPVQAKTWYLGIIKALKTLADMPKRCPIAQEDKDIGLGIRHLIVGNYRALFIIDGAFVKVLHLRHHRMDRHL